MDRLHQIPLEEHGDPEHKEQHEQARQDPCNQREPGKIERHHQQVEREHPQEQHREQVLRRIEPLQLVAGRGRYFRERLLVAFEVLGVDSLVERLGRVMCPVVNDPHPEKADQRHDRRGVEENHLGPSEDAHPRLVMLDRRRG